MNRRAWPCTARKSGFFLQGIQPVDRVGMELPFHHIKAMKRTRDIEQLRKR